MQKRGFVYIMTNATHRVLYIGVTSSLWMRVREHRDGQCDFTARYRCTKLVYFEEADDMESAIWREKRLKKSSRRKKESLIDDFNPEWNDLSGRIVP